MNYNDIIDQIKKELESYSKVDAELEELYRQAKERNKKSYELSKQQLAEQYYEDKNQAAAKAKLDEKDMSAFLAARGLATSGESVQAKIDSNMALNNILSNLAKENQKSLTELEKERLEKENELELSLAEKKLELNKQKNALSNQIEQLKKALEESSKQTNSDQTNTGSSNSGKNSNQTDKNNKQNSSNGSSNSGKNGNQPASSDKSYVPSTSAKDVAKNIAETYGNNGRITSDLQKGQIKKYLNSLIKNDGVNEDYIKDVIFNLKTYGYTDISDNYADAVLMADEASKYYDKLYYELYEFFIRGNRTAEKASAMANEKAKTMMLDYIYERSRTIAAFESAAKLAGATQYELEEYYKKLNNIMNSDEKITLGSRIM